MKEWFIDFLFRRRVRKCANIIAKKMKEKFKKRYRVYFFKSSKLYPLFGQYEWIVTSDNDRINLYPNPTAHITYRSEPLPGFTGITLSFYPHKTKGKKIKIVSDNDLIEFKHITNMQWNR